MADHAVRIKSELLADIRRNWDALNAALQRLTEQQMTTLRDPQGWTVKDHLVHLAAWERSMVFFLQHKPRHAGLGVDEALYLTHSFDAINDAIFRQNIDLPLQGAVVQLREVHQQLLALLQPLHERDLQLPYRHYLPEEPGEGDGPPAIRTIYNNTANHFAEHQEWIESLVEQESSSR